ncbi:MAG: DNA alkylation repair protein [Myxococcaceae bacterium]|nr:DNA alkylation repair protein [Myxococcaceae bacterium]
MPTDRDLATLTGALGSRLERLTTAKSRAFWTRYLKGTVPFRGVPMPAIRQAVHAWWRADGPSSLPPAAQKQLALRLFEGAFCEDKLAGTLVLQELLLGQLERRDLDALGALFDRGLIADWNTCDWFCVKVLGRLVARDLPRRELADDVASWSSARSLWQRRAANVAFVNLAKRGDANFEGFTALMLDTCATTVRSPERFAQTGVGWLLRELAGADRAAVLAFADEHLAVMSREAVRYVIERMPKTVQGRVLAAHRRGS